MHPVLLELPFAGGFEVHLYGVLAAMGFLVALRFMNREGERAGLAPDLLTNLSVGAVLAGVVGARILYVGLNVSHYSGQWLAMLNVRDGGLVFLGGLIGALLFAWFYLKREAVSFFLAGDLVMPGLLLGQAFGRVGCLSAGCCYGISTQGTWGIAFSPEGVGPLTAGVLFHPVQAYESFILILLFVLLAWRLRHKAFEGEIFLLYFILYSISRFSVEFLRGDAERGFVLESILGPQTLSTSQGISLLFFFPALAFAAYRWRRGAVG